MPGHDHPPLVGGQCCFRRLAALVAARKKQSKGSSKAQTRIMYCGIRAPTTSLFPSIRAGYNITPSLGNIGTQRRVLLVASIGYCILSLHRPYSCSESRLPPFFIFSPTMGGARWPMVATTVLTGLWQSKKKPQRGRAPTFGCSCNLRYNIGC